ncbi:MAG: hypothetical protein KDE27_25920 [Planctomycetes bacterium]|nr:hypothetical protein [Planctomycetota bacterium]
MHSTRMLALLTSLTAAAAISAQIRLPPPDLAPGASYRVLMVTVGSRDATSTDIADYDAFVQNDAAAVPQLVALGTTWSALASTAAVSARDHTMTDPTPAGPTGVPIYTPDGTRIADDYDALWGAATTPLLAPPAVFSTGSYANTQTWTGSRSTGLPRNPYVLGNAGLVALGGTNNAAAVWFGDGGGAQSTLANRHLYGMSGMLTVPSVPATQTIRLGTPANPAAYVPGTTAPIIGQAWNPGIDHTTFAPGSAFDLAVLGWAASNVVTPAYTGTVLVDQLVGINLTALPGSRFLLALPNEPGLLGVPLWSQGVSLDTSGAILLANAIDITIGNL